MSSTLAFSREMRDFDPSALARAASLSEGSVRRAMAYVDPETLALVEAVRARLDALPGIDMGALLALAEDVAGKAGERREADRSFEICIQEIGDTANAAIFVRLQFRGGGLRLRRLKT